MAFGVGIAMEIRWVSSKVFTVIGAGLVGVVIGAVAVSRRPVTVPPPAPKAPEYAAPEVSVTVDPALVSRAPTVSEGIYRASEHRRRRRRKPHATPVVKPVEKKPEIAPVEGPPSPVAIGGEPG